MLRLLFNRKTLLLGLIILAIRFGPRLLIPDTTISAEQRAEQTEAVRSATSVSQIATRAAIPTPTLPVFPAVTLIPEPANPPTPRPGPLAQYAQSNGYQFTPERNAWTRYFGNRVFLELIDLDTSWGFIDYALDNDPNNTYDAGWEKTRAMDHILPSPIFDGIMKWVRTVGLPSVGYSSVDFIAGDNNVYLDISLDNDYTVIEWRIDK